MPTGYTIKIDNGTMTELKDYLLECSRGFGIDIKEFDDIIVSDTGMSQLTRRYLNNLNISKEQFETFKKLTDDDIQKIIDMEHEIQLSEQKKSLEDFKEGKQRYVDMLDKVNNWIPPSRDHEQLKTFAIKQLTDSINYDYGDGRLEHLQRVIERETVEEYKKCKTKMYRMDIARHESDFERAMNRSEGVDAWAEALINSLK